MLVASVALMGAASAHATTETFQYTGASQTWIVPAGVTEATFDLYGAVGGNSGSGNPLRTPGFGGRATATLQVEPGTSIQVNVGGSGGFIATLAAGGFNGGGDGPAIGGPGHAGGGASDVRIGGVALTDRALVAGGGGGAGNNGVVGGDGGGEAGSDATPGGDGGTQTTGGAGDSAGMPGSFGMGGDAACSFLAVCGSSLPAPGAGGGGWYGGGGGDSTTGGGGGSGHGPPGTVFEVGVRDGNGLATVTYTEAPPEPPAEPAPTATCLGRTATIIASPGEPATGTSGPDVIVGTEGADEIRGLGGEDAVCALGGTDELLLGRGSDQAQAGGGDDFVNSRRGADAISGQGDNDELLGGKGDDALNGGAADDRLHGDGDDDDLDGGGGRNRLNGGTGHNVCTNGPVFANCDESG
jgi:hypothetical protein